MSVSTLDRHGCCSVAKEDLVFPLLPRKRRRRKRRRRKTFPPSRYRQMSLIMSMSGMSRFPILSLYLVPVAARRREFRSFQRKPGRCYCCCFVVCVSLGLAFLVSAEGVVEKTTVPWWPSPRRRQRCYHWQRRIRTPPEYPGNSWCQRWASSENMQGCCCQSLLRCWSGLDLGRQIWPVSLLFTYRSRNFATSYAR